MAGAIIEAMGWIRTGQVPAVLVIGADALTRLTMAGFHALQIVDPAGCRPFSRERAGMSLGEGAIALVIEDADHARLRGARPLARLLGWGLAGDAHHSTAPDPTGTWLGSAIGQALADAGTPASGISFVSAHGTGTRDNDACEVQVLADRFGSVPVSSTKRAIGHTMGASAGFGLAAAILALQHQTLIPVSAWTGTPLDGVDVVTAARPARVEAAMTTCLAFGGVNAAFIVGRV
jgi:3-oxoacyl-[acyl-carrier-protein] synthase II